MATLLDTVLKLDLYCIPDMDKTVLVSSFSRIQSRDTRLSRQRVSSLTINHPSFQFLPLRGLNWIHNLPSFEILRPREMLHGVVLHHFLLKLALAEKFPN